MKRILMTAAAAALTLAVSGCSASGNGVQPVMTAAETTEAVNEAVTDTETETVSESASDADTEKISNAEVDAVSSSTVDADKSGSGILVAYFSVRETGGTDTLGGASRVAADGELYGNKEYIARLKQQETGGDLFEIRTVQDYPTTHDQLLEYAYNEKSEKGRPEIAESVADPDSYDTIFLGYPIWNADLPMPLYTFLENTDLGGKTIIPFTVHGGSGFAGTIKTIESLQPNANVVEDGLAISRNNAADSAGDVTQWMQELGMTAQ